MAARTPVRSTPATWEPVLVTDLRMQFGRTCIPGTRIPYDGIAEQVWAGEAPESVADDYKVDVRDVYMCCIHWIYTGGLIGTRGRRRKVWLAWCENAHLVFGGHRKGKVGDPDDYEPSDQKAPRG